MYSAKLAVGLPIIIYSVFWLMGDDSPYNQQDNLKDHTLVYATTRAASYIRHEPSIPAKLHNNIHYPARSLHTRARAGSIHRRGDGLARLGLLRTKTI